MRGGGCHPGGAQGAPGRRHTACDPGLSPDPRLTAMALANPCPPCATPRSVPHREGPGFRKTSEVAGLLRALSREGCNRALPRPLLHSQHGPHSCWGPSPSKLLGRSRQPQERHVAFERCSVLLSSPPCWPWVRGGTAPCPLPALGGLGRWASPGLAPSVWEEAEGCRVLGLFPSRKPVFRTMT